MTALLMSLPSYQTWPLFKISALLVVAAVLVLATLPLLVTALVGLRAAAATERAMRLVPALAEVHAYPGSERR